MSSDFPGLREEQRDPMHFDWPEELQADPEPEPPFWPRHLLVGAALFAVAVALAVVAF